MTTHIPGGGAHWMKCSKHGVSRKMRGGCLSCIAEKVGNALPSDPQETPGEWPRFAVWRDYPFSMATVVMGRLGWHLRGNVLVIGRFAFAIMWKERAAKEGK